MEIIEAVIIGIVQGITEWLPVRSEGIISLIMINFFGRSFTGAVTIAIWLHIGTMLAALVYFRKDVSKILSDVVHIFKNFKYYSFEDKDLRLTNFIIVSSIISGIIGGSIFLFGLSNFEVAGSIATAAIGVMLLITGVVILLSKKTGTKKSLQMNDSVIAGVAQGISIVPGISRSGMTTSALLLRRYDAKKALAVSFIMSIPAVLLASLGMIFFRGIIININSVIAVALAFVTGLVAIKFMMKIAEKVNFAYFCFIIGGLALISAFFL